MPEFQFKILTESTRRFNLDYTFKNINEFSIKIRTRKYCLVKPPLGKMRLPHGNISMLFIYYKCLIYDRLAGAFLLCQYFPFPWQESRKVSALAPSLNDWNKAQAGNPRTLNDYEVLILKHSAALMDFLKNLFQILTKATSFLLEETRIHTITIHNKSSFLVINNNAMQ